MSKFLFASIGRKLVMSLTGFFLLSFISVHLFLNLLLIVDNSGDLFNTGAHFMATNPIIKIVEPILGLGFLIHIIWAMIIYINTLRARPTSYNVKSNWGTSSWASRNMVLLGSLVLTFLVIHLFNFYWKIKFAGDPLLHEVMVNGTEMENTYALVSSLFKTSVLYSLIYVVGAILLGFHLSHGFWSAFQTLGWNNKNWIKRLKVISTIFAVVVATGFSIIPLYFLIF